MNYVGRILSNFREFYKEINTATLTGAIDVVVVENEDGTYVCSPFHVRFGKMGVLRSREKVVDIEINGESVELHMKLGETGEAFFVEETQGEVPEYLATSPIPSVTQLMEKGLEQLHRAAEEENRPEDDLYPLPELIVKAHSDTNLASGNRENSLKSSSSDTTLLINNGSVSLVDETAAPSLLAGKSKQPSPTRSNEVQYSSSTNKKTKSRKKRRKSGKNKKQDSKGKADSESSLSDDLLSSDQSPTRTPTVANKKAKANSHPGEEAIFELEMPEEEELQNQKDHSGTIDSTDNLAPLSQIDEVKLNSNSYQMRDYHPFSDGDLTPCISPSMTRSPTPIKSDTEVEYQKEDMRDMGEENQVQWKWGELPEKRDSPESKQMQMNAAAEQGAGSSQQQKSSYLSSMWQYMRRTKKIRHSSNLDGIYLDELKLDELDPEVAALYFPQKGTNQADQMKEEGSMTEPLAIMDPSMSPASDEGEGARSVDSGRHSAIDTIESGHPDSLSNITMSLCGGLKISEDIPEDEFLSSIVTYEDFVKNPGILGDANLVVKYENKYYNWQTAAPIILSLVAFQKPLPQDVVDSLVQATKKSEKSSWFPWRRPSKSITVKDDQTDNRNKSLTSSPSKKDLAENKVEEASASDEEQTITSEKSSSRDNQPKDHYKKTIRLTSDQLASLKLHRGANEATFSVTTQYQGTSQCNCTIYLWRYDDKIVVSDIDGTITKSDALGQILPVFGKDWTQSGVASLYSSIQKNGYQFLYLSARAIGQAGMTRGYLNSVKQGEIPLPDGPLLLTPTSLISAFQKEVIERKPEEFKINCLRDIKDLFPANPFQAGFGNRINDVWAYTAVGIPICRIFTIDPKGVLRHELTQTFQSSYLQLSDLVDHLFPPLPGKTLYQFDASDKYSSFTYWRQPLPEVKLDDMV